MAQSIVDAWIRHPTGKFIAHDMFASLRRWMRFEVVPDEIPVELTLAALDGAGVSNALTSAWWGPEGPLLSNDEVAQTVSAHPDRFVGIGSVDLYRPMDAVRELRRCVKELGFVGVRQLPWLWGLPPNDRRYCPIYAECVELDVPGQTQGHVREQLPDDPAGEVCGPARYARPLRRSAAALPLRECGERVPARRTRSAGESVPVIMGPCWVTKPSSPVHDRCRDPKLIRTCPKQLRMKRRRLRVDTNRIEA